MVYWGCLTSVARLTGVVTAAVILRSQWPLGVGSPKLAHHEQGRGRSLESLPWVLDDAVPALLGRPNSKDTHYFKRSILPDIPKGRWGHILGDEYSCTGTLFYVYEIISDSLSSSYLTIWCAFRFVLDINYKKINEDVKHDNPSKKSLKCFAWFLANVLLTCRAIDVSKWYF